MKQILTRRDFLRLAGAVSFLPIVRPINQLARGVLPNDVRPNIIIILFDALSARHLSLYGYPRHTSPNLERFAKRATVFHQHHSAANFTTPSTASFFTGAYPFTHRVFAINGMVSDAIRPNNMLNSLRPVYPEAAWVQNMYADLVLYQLREDLEQHYGSTASTLAGKTIYDRWFKNDAVNGAKTYDEFLFDTKETPGALFGSLPLDIFRQIQKRMKEETWAEAYPAGLPLLDWAKAPFTLEQSTDAAQRMLNGQDRPYFSYIHFMPPHSPYRPGKEFTGRFDDNWKPVKKEAHPLSANKPQARLNELRQEYDEFIAHVDSEFGRFVDYLDSTGLMDTSYVIFTSDHGELFERGENGHVSPLLYEEIVHVPLLIHAPGQQARQDFQALTCSVDVFPTLAALCGTSEPDTLQGYYLPGLGLPEPPANREAWALEASQNSQHGPLKKASLALLRWPYKMIAYWGYDAGDIYEFYDLASDPEELENLIDSHPLAGEFKLEIENKRRAIDHVGS